MIDVVKESVCPPGTAASPTPTPDAVERGRRQLDLQILMGGQVLQCVITAAPRHDHAGEALLREGTQHGPEEGATSRDDRHRTVRRAARYLFVGQCLKADLG